jgi:hypothetical protein
MKLASLIATAVAALIMAASFTQPAAACGWKKSAYHGASADAGEVRGYRAYRSHRPYRVVRPAG